MSPSTSKDVITGTYCHVSEFEAKWEPKGERKSLVNSTEYSPNKSQRLLSCTEYNAEDTSEGMSL